MKEKSGYRIEDYSDTGTAPKFAGLGHKRASNWGPGISEQALVQSGPYFISVICDWLWTCGGNLIRSLISNLISSVSECLAEI